MSLENKLKKINLALALLIMLSPLVAHYEYIFPYIYLKNIFFRTLVVAGLFFMIWYLVYNNKISLKKYWIFGTFLIFLLVQIIATIFGVNMVHSLTGNFERMDGLINLLSLGVYLLLLLNTLKSTKEWLWIFRTSIITSLLVVAYEIFGRWGWIGDVPIPHNAGTIGNTLFLGSYLMFNVFFALLNFYIDKKKYWKIFYLLAIVIDVVFIFINASRSSMIGLVVGLGVLLLLMFFRVNKKIKILFIGLIFVFLAFVGTVITQKNSPWVQNVYFLERLTNISAADFSTLNRLLIWEVSLKSFYDRPTLGYGPENAMYAVDKYYNPEISEQWFDRVHNFVLDHLLNAGILGLLSFLAIFVLAFKASWQYLKKHYFLAASLIGLLTAYLVSNLFTFDSLVTWLPLVLVWAFIDFISVQDKEEKIFELPLWLRKGKKVVVLLVFLGLGVYTYWGIVIPTKANKIGLRGAAYSQVDINKALGYLQEAFDYNTYGNSEITRALADVAKLKISSKDINTQDKEKIVLETERQILYTLEKDPINVRMRMILADIYLDFSEYDSSYINKAIAVTEPAFEYSPERLEIYAIMARAYLGKNDLGKASEYLQKSLDIYDGREQDYMNVFYLLYKNNDLEKFDFYAKKYVSRFEDVNIENYNAISRYYLNIGGAQNLLASGIIDKLIATEPEELAHRLLFLDAYSKLGSSQEALDYIDEVSQTNPEWGAKLKQYWGLVKE